MKKSYLFLFALMLMMLGISEAMAQKIYRTNLEKSMFKAWTSDQPGAIVVENPEAIDVWDSNPEGTKFACDYNLYKALGDWSSIYGNTSAYYLWYADLTGTQKIYFTGTPGLHFWIQLNRQAPEESGSNLGGAMMQQELVIDDDGTAVYDCSYMEYVHLNCIKTKSAGVTGGVIKSIKIEGTVQPVTGILSMINNGDAEGDDLESFPFSYDSPNNGETANERPEIIDGEGIDGSRCFKVTAFDAPTEVWHSQFYIKADEIMPRGSKWKLKMAIKASNQCLVTTSAHGQPRIWRGGMIEEFTVGTEWREYTWSGEIGVDDFQSIAFDLSIGDEPSDYGGWNPGNAGTEFFFDNIEFGYDLGGDSPVETFQAFFEGDVIRLNLTDYTNIKDLVKAAPGGRFLQFPAGTFTVMVDGDAVNVDAAAAYGDDQIYIWINGRMDEDSEVEIAFNNPEDADTHLKFVDGAYDGQDIPSFAALKGSYLDDAGNGKVSPTFALPNLIGCEPEAGSFNLPVDLTTFVVSFDNAINVDALVAKLGDEELTKSASNNNKEITLTRTGNSDLNGTCELTLQHIMALAGLGEEAAETIKLSFGPVVAGEETIKEIYASNFSGDGDNANGAGWYVNAGDALQPANSGSGCRLMHSQGAFSDDLLYIAQRDAAKGGVAVYGIDDENKLTLEGGKTYHVTLKACRHDRDNVALRAQVLPEGSVVAADGSLIETPTILAEDFKAVTPEKTSKQFVAFDLAVTPEETGNFVIRLVPSLEDGSFAGYSDPICFGDVKVAYIPEMGLLETQALADALEAAKKTLSEISENTRYAGADQNALDAYIQDVEANKANYTAPSVYAEKTAGLGAAEKALSDHKIACDTYDSNIKKVINIVADKAETKFNASPVYADIKTIAEKYHGSVKKTEIPGMEGEEPVVIVKYTFDELTDNNALDKANGELTSAAKLGENFFTEVSLNADIQQGNCGIAVLTERIRLGARTLLNLGVPENDSLIVEAKNAMTDDNKLAARIKHRITLELYKEMMNPNSTLFDPTEEDLEAGIETGRTFDVTVFVKNPNIYCVDGTQDISEANVPGWSFPQGYPGLFKSWNYRQVAGLPEDCAFTTWFGTNRMEQTITDLPVGLYIVSLCGSDWSNQAGNSDNPHDVNGFVYCKTSETPKVEEGEEEDRDLHFAATRTIVYGGQYSMDHPINLGVEEVIDDETGFVKTTDDEDAEVFGIPVTDGKLTFGIQFAGDAQCFFQHVKLTLIAPIDRFDYEKAYQKALETNVDEDNDMLYVAEGTRISKSNPATLPISLKNEEGIKGLQFDIVLPNGMRFVKKYSSINEERSYTHRISANTLSNGDVRMVITSDENDIIFGNDGVLLNVGVNTSAMSIGTYAVTLKNITLTNSQNQTVMCNDQTFYVKVGGKFGDVNNDNLVNVTDVVMIIDHILQRNPENFYEAMADVNGDGNINVTDVVTIIDVILGRAELSRAATYEDWNQSDYTAFQMDLTIPAGYVLENVMLTDIAKKSHSLAYNMLANGRCRVVVYSMDKEALPGTWDEVIRLNLRGQGDAQVKIDHAAFVTIGGECHELNLNDATAITEISTLNSQLSTVYDLQGRKVEKNYKGIVLSNGKKNINK